MKDRIFTTKDVDGKDWVLKFKRPTQQQINNAELTFRREFSNSVRNDILIRDEAIKIIKKRKLYDSDEEKKELEIRIKIAELEDKLSEVKDYDIGKKICNEITTLREELLDHNSVVTSIMQNTCEFVANIERNQYYLVSCIYDDKTDKRVYKDIDDYKSKLNEQAALDSYQETLIANLETRIGRDLPSDLSQEFAENAWMNSNKKKEKQEKQEKQEEKPKKKSTKGTKKKKKVK